ncbi:uncharacterized protein LOC143281956 [Babylonia areolata]|uniref:uncharacterized protein LOC143281956 n=1 Tax=Babylonia areolata TaxID=304850 RepID=UPI003FCEFF92
MATSDVRDSQVSCERKIKSAGKSTSDTERTGNMADGDERKGGKEGEAQAVEFNLSDPEQLARQLDRVDLTEEESDELLREAYKVNKKLKMMLKQKQDKMADSIRRHSASSTQSQKGGSSILPPINAKGSSAAPLRSHRSYGQSPRRTGGNGNAASKSKSAKTKPPPQRPGWDDRFAFS